MPNLLATFGRAAQHACKRLPLQVLSSRTTLIRHSSRSAIEIAALTATREEAGEDTTLSTRRSIFTLHASGHYEPKQLINTVGARGAGRIRIARNLGKSSKCQEFSQMRVDDLTHTSGDPSAFFGQSKFTLHCCTGLGW